MLSPWPVRLPLWTGASDTFAPVWSQWYSKLVIEVNGAAPGTFAALPPTPDLGQQVIVTDSTTNAWGATIAGGGALQVLALWNGTVWTVLGR